MKHLKRIIFMANAGEGAPGQFAQITTWSDKMASNYDLTAVNVQNESENFIIFARPKAHFKASGEMPGINNEDVVHLAEFVYELALKTYYSAEPAETSVIVEIDVTSVPGVEEMFMSLKTTHPLSACNYAKTPMTMAFFSASREHTRRFGRPIELCLTFRSFSPDECRLHFFPNCPDCGGPRCCKVRRLSEVN